MLKNRIFFEVFLGDMTTLSVDALVNPTNTHLTPGIGLDGKIHEKAGEELLNECNSLGSCEVGDAKMTKGYRLKAKNVIHTVGPKFSDKNAEQLLANCYVNCLTLAFQNNLTSIAFPSISTGVYAYPLEQAANVAVKTMLDFAEKHETNINFKIIIAVYDKKSFEIYRKLLHLQ